MILLFSNDRLCLVGVGLCFHTSTYLMVSMLICLVWLCFVMYWLVLPGYRFRNAYDTTGRRCRAAADERSS